MAPVWADLLPLHSNAVPNMMRLLSCGDRGGHPFLHVFLEAGLASQLDCAVLNDTLLSLIETSDKTTPLGSVRILLESGAAPNHVRIGGQDKPSTSPLSAALLKNRPDMFRLLLERGANVHGVPVQNPLPSLPLHVPILAAAYAMATSTSTSQMKLCVEHGADINVCAPFFTGRKKERKMSFTTPLRLYTNHVPAKHWIDMCREPQVASDLAYLFDNGATFEGGADEGDTLKVLEKECRSAMHPPTNQFTYQSSVPLPTVEVIIGEHPIAVLPALLPALDLIIQHGALRYNTGAVLARYDYGTEEGISSSSDADISRAWTLLLTRLLSHDEIHEPLDMFLHNYITTKGTCTKTIHRQPCSSHLSIGPLATLTIRRLIVHGADINFRLPQDYKTSPRPTPLHSLAYFYGNGECASLDHRLKFAQRITSERVEFVRFLVEECGADLEESWEGRGTAGEILAKGVRRLGDKERMLALGEGEGRWTGLFRILGVPVT